MALIKYAPESPKKFLFKALNIKKTNKVNKKYLMKI